MAASTQQKVDFLLKKIGYTASKTGLAEDSSLSGTKKAPFSEAVPSPLVIASSSVWADSADIPGTPPGSDSSYVKVYLGGTSGHHMTVDSTVSGNRSYIAYTTYNNNSTAILGDWIDTQFGSSYIIKVYKGDPNSGGVQLSAAGSGSSDGWFFDYSSGILNFNDTNVPSGVTDSNIYVVGYRYIGTKGVVAPGGVSNNSQLNVTGVSTFTGAVDANGGADISGGVGLNVVGHTEVDNFNASGVSTFAAAIDANAGILASTLKVEDLTATRVVLAGTGGEIEDNAKLTFTTDKLAVTGGLTVSAGATFAGIVDGNAGANISGGEATFASATVSDLTDNRVVIAGTSGALEDSGNLTFSGTKLTVTGNAQVTTDLDVDGGANISGGVGLNVVGHTELDEVNVSGVSTYGGAIDANGGADISGGVGLNVVGHTELDNVNVSGVSTYSAAADFNSGADISGGVGLNVVGHTELDEINVSGVSTFAALVDGNAGANFSGAETVLSSATVSDLTDNRVVLAGTAGSLEDSSSITFDGSNLAIVGGATFTGNVTIGGTLTSEDKTNVDSVGLITARTGVRITSGGLIVSAGVNTFTDAIDANGGANIAGGFVANSAKVSDLTSGRVVVAGTDGELEDASTFTFSGGTVSATAFSGTNLTGTLQTAAQTNVTSLGTLTGLAVNGGADISGGVGLNVVGHTELDNLNVSGVSTYAGSLNANGTVNIAGQLVTVHNYHQGVSTFVANIDANRGIHVSGGIGLEVVGHTELDNLVVSGVSTFSSLVDGNAGANFSGAETVLSSATVSDLTENRIVIAGADGVLEDASTLTFDGTKVQVGSAITMYQATGIVSATYFYGDGSNLLNAGSTLSAASAVQRVVTTSLTSGTMTTAGTDADLTFDTSSNTLNAGKVNVTGVGTFGGLIDGNAGATITGAETTLSSATVSDLTDERVVLAGSSGALEDSGNLTFNGTKLTVTGNAQVTTDLDVDGGANISGGVGLNVVGHTELDEVNISGVSTYGGAADFNAGVLASTLKVEDLAGARVVVSGTGGEIEDSSNLTWVSNGSNYLGLTGGLTVSAASTFSGIVDGNAGANFSGAETTLSSATVSDLTAGRVVVAGTSGALEDASTFTVSGGTVSATAFSATDLTGTLQTAAQGNVTSLGTLTGLTVSGDFLLDASGTPGRDVFWDSSASILRVKDSAKASFGNSDQFYISRDGANTYLSNSTNGVYIDSPHVYIRTDSGSDMAHFNGSTSVDLFFNNAKKIETSYTGAIVTGILTATDQFSGQITGVGATFTDITGTLATAAQTNITSLGTLTGLTISGDESIADKIVHTGDTNTAIRFPANDTVSVETAGSEAFRVDSSQRLLKGLTTARGNYGNNTSGVEYGLQVEGLNALNSTIALVRNSNDANDGGIVLGKTRATSVGGNTVVQAGDDLGAISWAGSDGTSLQFGAEILAEVQTGVGDDDMPADLIFKTNAGGTSTGERLRLTSDGKVLIGTDTDISGGSAASVLQVLSASGSYLSVGRNDTTVASGNGLGGFRFYSNDTNINSGNYLQVGGISCDADGDFLSGDAPTRLTFSTMTDGTTTLAERLRIDSSGLVGIGTVNPTSLLTVGARPKTTSAAATVLISPASGNASVQLRGGSPTLEFDGTGGGNGQIFTDSADLAISNGTIDGAGTELVRISSGGDVGIGTVNPSRRLHVTDYGDHGVIRIEGSGNTKRSGIEFYRETSAGVGKGGAAIWVESDTSSSAGKLRFGTASNAGIQSQNTDMILDNNGSLGIGTASPQRIIHAFEPTENSLLFLESGDTNTDIIQADTGGSTRIRNSQGSLVFYVNGDAKSSSAANAVTGLTIDADKDVHVYDDLFIPDKIIHEGDTNTAIRFPAADTFTVETNGSERLRITSQGSVGINSTSPVGTLDVSTTVGAAATVFIYAANHNASAASEAELRLAFAHSGSPEGIGYIKLKENGTNVFDGNLVFGVPNNNGSGGSVTNDVLFIKGSNQRVGIGTDIPEALLQIEGTEVGLQIERNAQTLKIDANYGNGGDQSLTASSALRIYTGGANERLRITSEGYLKYSGTSTADETNKLGRLLMPSHDTNEEDVMYLQMQQEGTFNQLELGGGSSSYNAATKIIFRTAAVDTVTGTSQLEIDSTGLVDFQSNTVQKAVLKNYTETIKAIGNTGTSTTLDLADGNVFTATLNGNCTFTFTTGTNSAPNMQSFSLILSNDGTPSRTIAWPASVKFPNASTPSRTTTANKTDIWSFMSPDNGTTWYGNIALYNFS